MDLPSRTPAWRLAVDTGGAFTSGCAYLENTGETVCLRVPSDPGGPAPSALRVLAGLCDGKGMGADGLELIIHGTTAADGMVPGTAIALLVTRGFRDILYVGRNQQPRFYDPEAPQAVPPVSRRFTFEVDERVLPDGQVLTPLREHEVAGLIPRLRESGIRSVAVCFLHSYANPAHEQRTREILSRQMPEMPVILSSDILPVAGEYERACAAVISAACRPLVDEYLGSLGRHLEGLRINNSPRFFFMQSDGTLATSRHARAESARIVLSGSAGGVLACLRLAQTTGRPNLITFDMGASGARISLIIRGRIPPVSQGRSQGRPLGFPSLEIITRPVGGASTARLDPGGKVRVGPGCAGSRPGPACYGRGGTLPTCTDANLLLGRISPRRDLPGGIRPDAALAREALEKHLAAPLGITADLAAREVIKAANAVIARAIRTITLDRGYDPREFTLVSFGGSAPQHAAELALELGIPRVLVPRRPGTQSALGMLFADVHREYSINLNIPADQADTNEINEAYSNLEARAREELAAGGVPLPRITVCRSAVLRLRGQGGETDMQVPAGKLKQADLNLLNRAFKLACQAECGFLPGGAETEIVRLKLAAVGKTALEAEGSRRKSPAGPGGPPPSPEGSRAVVFHGNPLETPVYHRSALGPPAKLKGPAVVEEDDTTILVWPGMSASADLYGNMIIEVENK